MKHYIHCHQGIDMKKGGTVGYLSSLLDGMEKLGTFCSTNGLRHSYLFPDIGPNGRLPNVQVESLISNSPFHQAYRQSRHSHCVAFKNWFHSAIPSSEARKVDLRKITSIHIHGAYNFMPVYNFLRLCGIENDVVKILTTHNPWKPELEDLFHLNKNKSEERIKKDKQIEDGFKHYLRLRDAFAFKMSDVLFFPSKSSMDGYYESWPEFKRIVKNKPVYFSLTGTEGKEVSVPRSMMRKSLRIPSDAFVFLYLGRFIPMRGFDMYTEVASRLLREHDNVYFLAVGEDRETPAVNHERWIEVAHTLMPGDYLNMSDACVMANRGSYFDLSMIEALAQGITLIAAKVGGYKYLEGKTTGVKFFNPGSTEGLYSACKEFCLISNSDLLKGTEANLELYRRDLTPKKFAQGYFDTIDCMYSDLSISLRDRPSVSFGYPDSVLNKEKDTHLKKNHKKSSKKSGVESPKKKEKRAVSMFKKGLFSKSVEAFYDCIEIDPGSTRLRRMLAEALLSSGNRLEAISQLELARRSIPKNKNLRNRLIKIKYGKLAFWTSDNKFI